MCVCAYVRACMRVCVCVCEFNAYFSENLILFNVKEFICDYHLGGLLVNCLLGERETQG